MAQQRASQPGSERGSKDAASAAKEVVEGVQEKVGAVAQDAADAVQAKAEDIRDNVKDTAADAADSARENAAAALEGGAKRVGEMGGDGMAATATDFAAGGMRDAAQYLRANETDEIWADVERYVRRYPARSLFAAIAAGVVVGKILR